MTASNFMGEIAALSAALLWAISSVVYTRLGLKIPPLKLNLYKGIIAIAFIIPPYCQAKQSQMATISI